MNNLYRRDGWVKSTLAPAIPGAQIWVCSQPANTAYLPPTPLVYVFSDPAGTVSITLPILTDGYGHYSYYIAPGLYTEVVAFGGKVSQVYPDQSVGNVGTAGTSTLLLETNGTPNFNQNLQNLTQGSGITLATDNLGNTTITSTLTPVPPPTPFTAAPAWRDSGDGSPYVSQGYAGSVGNASNTIFFYAFRVYQTSTIY